MDPEAARRARAKVIKENLAEAFDDDEACPPEWVDLKMEIDQEVAALNRRLHDEVERFATEPDIRVALARRERTAADVREQVGKLNVKIRRLNLITPLVRVQRAGLDAEAMVLPLFRTPRAVPARSEADV